MSKLQAAFDFVADAMADRKDVVSFKQRLAELEAQARRYRFIWGMAKIEPDSPEGEALNEILERPDLQPDDYSQEAFGAKYDAMLAAASEKCPTIAAALNMEI